MRPVHTLQAARRNYANTPGVKQTQRAHEEAHVIMWYSSILTELRDVGVSPSKEAIAGVFQRFRAENLVNKIPKYKVDIVTQLILNVPQSAVDVFKNHLHERRFERSALTQDILNSKQLLLDYTPPGCVGAWTKWLCNREEVCCDIARAIVQHFERQFAGGTQSEDAAGSRFIKACRASDSDIVQFQASSSLYYNWLRPTVQAEEPHAIEEIHSMYLEGHLRQDLYRLSMSKMSAQVGATLTLRGVPAVDATLKRLSQDMRAPRTDEQLRRVAEGKRAEWLSIQGQAKAAQEAFVDFVQESCGKLLQDAVARAEAITFNATAGPAAATQFLNKHVRVLAVTSSQEVTAHIEKARQDIVDQWGHKCQISRKDQVPTVLFMHVDDVPLKDWGEKERRTAAEVEAESKAGDARLERGKKQAWLDLLAQAASQVTTYPAGTMLMLIHGKRSPANTALPQYNWDFQKVLVDAKLDVDLSLTILWKAQPRPGALGSRVPRTATVATGKNPTSNQPINNLFLHATDLSGGVIQDMPLYTQMDLLRVQNVESLRELDVLDSNNMSSEERRTLLGQQWWLQLTNTFVDAAQQRAKFEVQDRDRGRRGPTGSSAHKSPDSAVKKQKTEGEPVKAKAEGPSGSAPGPAQAQAAAGSASPLLVVGIGVSNGNQAMAMAELTAKRGMCVHYLGLDFSATAVEFCQRRVGEWAYTKWFSGELDLGEKPRKIRSQTYVYVV